jgi:prophage regulatory protein
MNSANLKILRKPEACNLAGLSNTSLFEQTRAGIFPPPISLGARAVGKSDDEIRQIVKALIKQREQVANDLLASLAA